MGICLQHFNLPVSSLKGSADNLDEPLRDSTSTLYKTVDTVIQRCIHHITLSPHRRCERTLHSYTDDHRGQLIANVISNSDHITLNIDILTRVPTTHYNKHPYQISPHCLTHYITGPCGHNIPNGNMHSNCRLLPDHIVCKITQRNNTRRANPCDPAFNLLNDELTSDKHNLWKEHLDAQ